MRKIYIYLYKILYSNSRFKWIIFRKYTTNLKTTISQKSLLLLFEFSNSSFIKDIIDHIIYTSVSLDQNSHQWLCSILVIWYRWSHMIMILHCHWWEFWSHNTGIFIILSIISIKNEKIMNSNNNRSKSKFLRILWDIVVFRLVVYFLNMIRLNLLFLYKI